MTDSGQTKCLVEMKKQVEGHPEYVTFDGTGLSGGQAQVGTADAGLPHDDEAVPGQPKLKLTFNNSVGGDWPMNEDE